MNRRLMSRANVNRGGRCRSLLLLPTSPGGMGRWEGRSVLSAPSTCLCKDHPSPKPCPPRLKMSFTQLEYGGPAGGCTALGSECTERDEAGERKTDRPMGLRCSSGSRGSESPQRSWRWTAVFCFASVLTELASQAVHEGHQITPHHECFT